MCTHEILSDPLCISLLQLSNSQYIPYNLVSSSSPSSPPFPFLFSLLVTYWIQLVLYKCARGCGAIHWIMGRLAVNTVSKWHGSTFSCSCQLSKAPCNGWALESAFPIHARVEAGICRQPLLLGVHDCNSPVIAEDNIAQRPSLSSCSYIL